MPRTRRSLIALALVVALVGALTACQNARVGQRCRGNGTAQDATHVLVCRNGRWQRWVTKAEAARFVVALIQARNNATTTTTAPPTTAPSTTSTTTTTTTPPPSGPYAIAAGYQHTCAVIAGAVKCVGTNVYGQLGDGTTNPSINWVATGITDGVAVSAGSIASCALRANGTVWCWGFGSGGLLGNGLNSNSSVPVQVSGITDATQISVGANGGCARTAAGLAKCWGARSYRGDGGLTAALTPATASIINVVEVRASPNHICARKTDATVWCWGQNGQGQLGNGTTGAADTPVQVSILTSVVSIAAGGFNGAACAVRNDGTVWCWGDDEYGQLGDGDTSPADRLSPNQVATITDATKVTVGFYHSCALRSGGAVKCWGLGGQLGTGSVSGSTTPVDVTGVAGAADIDGQSISTCVLLSTNGAACWGSNTFGELGRGDTSSGLAPAAVVGMP